MSVLLAAVLGYVLGAIPFGLLIGRLTRGIDLRDHGSQRTGATNALRTLGPRAATAVLLLDVGKGVAAVLLARALFAGDSLVEWSAASAGFASIVGHNWSAFIRFTGGRGAATSTGALGAMSPWTLVVLIPIVAVVVWRTRYVSLGSIIGALLAPVITGLLWRIDLASVPAIAYALAAAALVVGAHADNIARLRAGTERRIGQKGREAADVAS
jgi:glycerol-3-phosphate acyltransferase PlsY